MFNLYAEKLIKYHEEKPGNYTSLQLSSMALGLPFAESHMALDGIKETDLPKIGRDKSLQEHMQKCFFEVIKTDTPAYVMTTPVLLKIDHLEALEHWREWQVLSTFLKRHDLEPVAAFRNTPKWFSNVAYYVSDIRVMFHEGYAFKA